MLGALARWLRALDVDVLYDPALDDPELVERAVAEGRTILTRDRRLTERRLARNHLLIRSDDVAEQLRQVLGELDLHPDPHRLLGRCLRCNVPLEPIDPGTARARVPPWVARTQQEFRTCPVCGAALDLPADPMTLEFGKDFIEPCAGDIHLIERLHRREPCGAAAISLAFVLRCAVAGHGSPHRETTL